MKRIISIVAALVIGVVCVSVADALSDAKDRRKARRDAVEQVLKSGAAEEGADGYLVAKKKDAEDIVKAENADRKIGYAAIAKNRGLTIAEVGKQAAASKPKPAAQ